MVGWKHAVAFVAVLVGACANDETVVPDQTEGFSIRQHDVKTFDATLTSGGSSLHVVVTEVQKDVVDVTYDFGDPVIGFHLDYRQGLGEFQPNGTPLDAAQSRLLEMLFAEIVKLPEMTAKVQTRVDEATFRQTNFMQIVPTGEALETHRFAAAQGWTMLSCTCKSQNLAGDWRICGKGSGCTGGSGNGCKGRCGTGCSPCAGTTAYTVDCGRHDYGIGSFAAASDDFTFAPNNCSC